MAGKFLVLHFFVIVFVASFVWYWFPGYIFQALSYFSWITWIKPNNVIINQVFGSSSGLGMIPNNIALDWNQIAGYIGSPLIPPASVIATIFGSIVVIFWIVVPAIHYSTLGTPNTCQSHLLDRLIGSNKLIMCQNYRP